MCAKEVERTATGASEGGAWNDVVSEGISDSITTLCREIDGVRGDETSASCCKYDTGVLDGARSSMLNSISLSWFMSSSSGKRISRSRWMSTTMFENESH